MYEDHFDPANFEKQEIIDSISNIEKNIANLWEIDYITNFEKAEIEFLVEKLKQKLYEFDFQNLEM